jgi:exopolysaccharide biosynthesis protein
MNAGPFHKDGSPVGWLISQGRVISKETNTTSVTSYAGFGKTWDGYYYIGVPPIEEEEDDEPSVLLQDFVTGFGWLVYQGKSVFEDPYNDTDDNPTGADRAPRSAIGIDSHGKVLWLIVDGCQFWYENSLRRGTCCL